MNKAPQIDIFNLHLKHISALFQEFYFAAPEDHALFFLKNDLRTPFFMLEALCRIFRKIYKKKFFETLLADFKEIEDISGEIDYYNNYKDTFKTIPNCENYCSRKMNASYEKLSKTLVKKKWISKKKLRLKKIESITEKLHGFRFHDLQYDLAKITLFLRRESEKIISLAETNFILRHDVENGLHEVRRKIRWMSIYPMAASALFKLKETHPPENLKAFLPENISESEYVQIPEKNKINEPIYIEKYHFYALSFLIGELGAMKDRAQLLELAGQLESKNLISENEIKNLLNLEKSSEDEISIIKLAANKIFRKIILEHHLFAEFLEPK